MRRAAAAASSGTPSCTETDGDDDQYGKKINEELIQFIDDQPTLSEEKLNSLLADHLMIGDLYAELDRHFFNRFFVDKPFKPIYEDLRTGDQENETKTCGLTKKTQPKQKRDPPVISIRVDASLRNKPRLLIATLLHEMIHAFEISVGNDIPGHPNGPNFKRLADLLSSKTGLEIE